MVDNGKGISSFDMNSVGLRYLTSKCQSLADLKQNTKRYGFRGEALASIAEVSGKLKISSKLKGTSSTYTKVFENGKMGKVHEVEERPEHGTTITVENFLQTMHVRQQRIKPDLDLDHIKQNMKYLAVIHPNVSFTLRNNVNGKMILEVSKTKSVSEALVILFSEIEFNSFTEFKVSKKHVGIAGLICQKSYENNHIQLIYVNKRPVECQKIRKLIKKLYLKACASKSTKISFKKNEHPLYILNIRSALANVDFTMHPSKTIVVFRKIDDVLQLIQESFSKFWEIDPLEVTKKATRNFDNCKVKSDYGVSIIGAITSLPVKRKSRDAEYTVNEQINARDILLNDQNIWGNAQKKIKTIEPSKQTSDRFEESLNDVYHNQLTENTRQENTQKNGKDLVMEKFLKSLETYKNNIDYQKSHKNNIDYQGSQNSNSEVLVEKTEQNLYAAKKDQNTTVAFSIKIQREKTLKKKRSRREHEFASKCVQTTFLEDNACKMSHNIDKTSKCVQTSTNDNFECDNPSFNDYNQDDFNAKDDNLLSVSQYFENNCNFNNKAQILDVYSDRDLQPFKKPKIYDVFKVSDRKNSDEFINFKPKVVANVFNNDLNEINTSVDIMKNLLNETVEIPDVSQEINCGSLQELNLGFCYSKQNKNLFESTIKQTEALSDIFDNGPQELFPNTCKFNLDKENTCKSNHKKECKFFNTFNSHPYNAKHLLTRPGILNKKRFSDEELAKRTKCSLNLSDITLSPIQKCQVQEYDNKNKVTDFNKRRRYLSLKKMCDDQRENLNKNQSGKSIDVISNSTENMLDNRMDFVPQKNENLTLKPFNELFKNGNCYSRKRFSGCLLGGNKNCVPENNAVEHTISTPRINESTRSVQQMSPYKTDNDISINFETKETQRKERKNIEIDVSIDSIKPAITCNTTTKNSEQICIDLDTSNLITSKKSQKAKELENRMLYVDLEKSCGDLGNACDGLEKSPTDLGYQHCNFENSIGKQCIGLEKSRVDLESACYGLEKSATDLGDLRCNLENSINKQCIDLENCNNIWEKRTDYFGNMFYFNKRTGSAI